MSEEESIKTTITLPADLLWKFKEEATGRRMTFKGAVAQAFERWLYGAMPATSAQTQESPPVPLPLASNAIPELQSLNPRPELGDLQWLEKLLYILHHGDADTQESIQKNLVTFERYSRLLRGESHGLPAKLPPEVPADHEGRMDVFSELDARYPEGRSDTGEDEERAREEKGKGPSKTGTGGNH